MRRSLIGLKGNRTVDGVAYGLGVDAGGDVADRAAGDHELHTAANVGRFARVDLVGGAIALVAVIGVNALVVRSGLLWIVPAALIVCVGCLTVAVRIADHGRPLAAIALVTAGHWTLALVVPIALPFLWPIVVLVAVIPLVLAAPHVPLRVLVGMIAGAAAVSAAVAVIGLDADDRGAVPDIADGLELLIVVVALTLLMVPIALVVWQDNRSQRRTLDEALLLNDELARSRRRIVEAGNDARRRIERDLHDGAQQRLVALGMRMRALEAQLADAGGTSPELAAGLTGLIGEVDRTLDELRDLAHGVYPSVLSTHGLVAAFAAVAQGSPDRVVVHGGDRSGSRPDRSTEEALYFTGLEAIANATKHAPDSLVEVSVAANVDEVVVTVRDDGPGFDPIAVGDSTGLSNMRDRVASLGGRLAIESAVGAGTTVTARVPVR